MAQSHLGRPAPDYFPPYSLTTAIRTPPPTELEQIVLTGQAFDAIRRIHLLSNKKRGPELDADSLARQIPLSWLTTILDAIRSPSSFILLTSEILISVCIRLMSTIKHCGKPSPFSYEYGYVCFRIVTVAMGANILHRAEVLKNIAEDMDSKPNTICLEVFSERISQFVVGAIHAQEGPSYCDFILGWAPRNNQECKEPLVDQSDALSLLNLLYVDRKAFLESLYSTHSPGLSGVYFLLWRHYRTKRPEKEKHDYNCPSESQTTLALCELIWRYFLIAPAIHDWVMTGIFNDLGTHTMVHEWKPGFVDTEDAQTIVRIFLDRLLSQDAPPSVRVCSFTAGRLLAFVRHYVEFGAVDMIPPLLRNVVRNEWYMTINGRDYEPLDQTVDGTGMILSQLARPFERIQPLSSGFAEELIDYTIKEDLLGLVMRLMLGLEPDYESPNDSYFEFLAAVNWFYQVLCGSLPSYLIQSKFENSFHDWLKCQLYFEWRERAISNSDVESKHWLNCIHYHIQLRNSMQQHDTQAYSMACEYARCPNPEQAIGAQYVCQQCGTFYCSKGCQSADLKAESWRESHRDRCTNLLDI